MAADEEAVADAGNADNRIDQLLAVVAYSAAEDLQMQIGTLVVLTGVVVGEAAAHHGKLPGTSADKVEPSAMAVDSCRPAFRNRASSFAVDVDIVDKDLHRRMAAASA